MMKKHYSSAGVPAVPNVVGGRASFILRKRKVYICKLFVYAKNDPHRPASR